MWSPQRYSRVPWLTTADLEPMGDPETYIELGDDERFDGLHIPEPFGKDTDATLSIHSTRGDGNDGGRITLAIGTVMQTTQRPKGRTYQPYIDAMQAGTPRNPRSQADGYTDQSNGANDPDED
jgi:hypothetical protein